MSTTTHPLLTDEAVQACAMKARKAVCDAGDMLLALHGRAVRRFGDDLSEDARQAIAELSALSNHMVAVLARLDKAETSLSAAMTQE